MNNNDTSIQNSVMDKIHKGNLHMRPRWYFILRSSLYAVGAIIVIFSLLYLVSLALFLLHDTGALSATFFGARGWFAFVHTLPLFLILLAGIFVCVLQILVREYKFVYHKPVLVSLGAIVLLIFVGGFLIARSPLHRTLSFYAHHHMLPPVIGQPYQPAFRGTPPDLFRGTIISMSGPSFIISDQNGAGTTTVIVTPHTRLPDGDDFKVGTNVVVMGDRVATDTVQAYGIGKLDD